MRGRMSLYKRIFYLLPALVYAGLLAWCTLTPQPILATSLLKFSDKAVHFVMFGFMAPLMLLGLTPLISQMLLQSLSDHGKPSRVHRLQNQPEGFYSILQLFQERP